MRVISSPGICSTLHGGAPRASAASARVMGGFGAGLHRFATNYEGTAAAIPARRKGFSWPALRQRVAPIGLIVAAFILLAGLYSVVVPLFEASDELSHYPVVKHLADGKGLIVQQPGVETAWKQEGSQPPLYYALAAGLTSWIDTDDLPDMLWYNLRANIGNPLAAGNKNMIFHTEAEAFPWQRTALAVHLARFLSILLQSGTIYFTYRLSLEVSPGRSDVAALAALLIALNPMFLFIAGSVNNDNLVVPLATLALWLLARILRRGWPGRGEIVALGAVLGCAGLAKLSGLTLLPLAGLTLAAVAFRRYRLRAAFWRQVLLWGLALGGLVVLIAGWWYVRNWQLYGDPTGLNAMLAVAGRRSGPFGWRELLAEFEGFRMSFWGVFGGFTIVGPRGLYIFYDAVAVLALAGWAIYIARERSSLRWPGWALIALLLAWVFLVLVALIRWTSQTYASQGRLLFPAIGAIEVLAAIGLSGWSGLLPGRAARAWSAVLIGALAVVAVVVPFALIRPAYAAPPLLAAEQVPADARMAERNYDGIVRVIGSQVGAESVRPGDVLPVTVYWEVLRPDERDLTIFVDLLGRDALPVGKVDTYLGYGAYPLSRLRAGQVVADTYQVPVAYTATAPSLLRVEVGLFEPAHPGGPGFAVTDATGAATDRVIGTARLLPAQPPAYDIAQPVSFDLGGQAALVGYDLPQTEARRGETITPVLYWAAQQRMTEDYQVLLHLVGADGKPLAQGDKTPLDGHWPTSAWEPGYIVKDAYPLSLPADLSRGTYQLRAGLYRLGDWARLPVSGPADRIADSSIILGEITVR
jgi:4-amino-4-deoxy-L-arabinose transferase-like glycosyltransferase